MYSDSNIPVKQMEKKLFRFPLTKIIIKKMQKVSRRITYFSFQLLLGLNIFKIM